MLIIAWPSPESLQGKRWLDNILRMRLGYFLSPPQGDQNTCQIQSGTRRCLPYQIKSPESPSNPITVTMKNGTRMSIKSWKHAAICSIAFWPPSELALCQQKEIRQEAQRVRVRRGCKHFKCVTLYLALWGERDRTASQGLISVISRKHNSKEGEFREWTKGNENTSYKGSSLCSVHHQSFDLPSQYPGAPALQDSCPEQMTTVAFLLDMTPIHWQVLSTHLQEAPAPTPSPQPHPLGPGYRPRPAS